MLSPYSIKGLLFMKELKDSRVITVPRATLLNYLKINILKCK